jgi:alkylation response protein AidB-like acyl-CoA dehydrogenase
MHQGPGLAGEAETFRREVCEWLTRELAPERTAPHAKSADRTGLAESFERDLQREAGRRGWLGVSLPAELGGGGRSPSFAGVFGYEAAYHDAPLIDTAVTLAGAPIVAFGTPDQHADLLPRMLSGEIEMCIAYTEPEAGNDLAALTSAAKPLPDGGYLLSGHKTLITGADKADLCLTIARTDPGAPARRGSSMFLVDMNLPGISVIPQRTMAGYDLWEVIFDEVMLAPQALLGKQDGGWRQLKFAVEQERTGMFSLGWCQRLFDEILDFGRTPSGGVRPGEDPAVVRGLAQLWADLQVGRLSALALVAQENAGERSGATASAAKVVLTELAQRMARFATEVGGPAAIATGSLFGPTVPGVPAGGRFSYEYLFRFEGSVAVGANELHRIGIAANQLGVHARRGSEAAPGQLDLLADGAPFRTSVRNLLAGGGPKRRSLASGSNLGYDSELWEILRLKLWPWLGEPAELRMGLEELGRAGCSLPVQAGLVQAYAALQETGEAGVDHLRRLHAGHRYAMGMHDAWGRPAPDYDILRATPGEDGAEGERRISGIVRHVTYGDSAHILLVPVTRADGGLILAAIPSDAIGISRTTRDTIANDRLTDFTFGEIQLVPEWIIVADTATDRRGEAALLAAQNVGVMALCAESVGMAAALLERTVARIQSRHAFGGPLAALPTVQLRVAEMYLDFTAAQAATTELASAIRTKTDDLALTVAATKITVTAAASRIAAGAHQVCGGWGQLEESGLHAYTRAIKAAEGQLGTPGLHRERLGRMLAG